MDLLRFMVQTTGMHSFKTGADQI